jgi:hypothetical protein
LVGVAVSGGGGDLVGLLARYSNRDDLLRPLTDLLQRLEQATPDVEPPPRQVASRAHRRPVRYRLTDADVQQLVELYEAGATGQELAAKFCLGLTSVKRLLRGIHHTPKFSAEQTAAIFACYRAGIGPRELSRRYGVTERTIKYLLQKYGVQRRRLREEVTEGIA